MCGLAETPPSPDMTYAFVEDIAASWEHYARFAEALDGPLPDGLVLHVAGPTDEGFRIIAVWESEDAWDRFCADRLALAPTAMSHPPPVFRALRPAHVVTRGDGVDTTMTTTGGNR